MSKNKNRKQGLHSIDPIGKLCDFGALIAGLALVLMMFIGTADVIMGKLFNKPVPSTLETTVSLLVMSFFMALGFTQLHKGNIAVELFKSRVTGTKRYFLTLLAYFLSLVLFSVLAFQGWKFALYSLRIREFLQGPIDFPLYPAKLIAAFGLSVVTLQCFNDLVHCIYKIARRG